MTGRAIKAQLRESFPRIYIGLRNVRSLLLGEPVDPDTRAVIQRLTGGELRVLAGPFG